MEIVRLILIVATVAFGSMMLDGCRWWQPPAPAGLPAPPPIPVPR